MSGQTLERNTGVVLRPSRAGVPRKTLLIAGVALLAAAGGSRYGYDWWTVGRFFESTDDAYVGADVTVIAPKVAGLIAQVAVTDNQPGPCRRSAGQAG